MHRYRKGQIFRPPTAMESAATADAVEGYRVRPGRPQDHSPVGQTVIAKTPEDGILACGEDEVIHWIMCKRVIQRGGSGDREMALTSENVPVWNILSTPIPGNTIVATAMTECGVRYVLPNSAPSSVQLSINNFFSASGTNAGYFSHEVPISFKVTSSVAGTAADAGITLLTPTAYLDPCFTVNLTGVWRFDLAMQLANYTIPFSDWTGSVVGSVSTTTPPAFPGVGADIKFEHQTESGEDWNSLGVCRAGVYFFHTNPYGPLLCSYSFAADLSAGDKVRIHIIASSLGGVPDTSVVQIYNTGLAVQYAGT